MNVGESINISTPTYDSTYRRLSLDCFRMDHVIVKDRPAAEFDVFGAIWTFTLAELDPGQVSIRRGNVVIGLRPGPVAVFIPPFSLIEWRLGQGETHFTALLSTAAPPPNAAAEPVAFAWDGGALPTTPAAVAAALDRHRGAGRPDFLTIGRSPERSGLALAVKRLIDQTFASDVSLDDLAVRLAVSPAALSRAFKRVFGLPPVAYRGRLRVAESIRRLLYDADLVSEIGYSVGFEDLSRFNKQFIRQIKTQPSRFQAR